MNLATRKDETSRKHKLDGGSVKSKTSTRRGKLDIKSRKPERSETPVNQEETESLTEGLKSLYLNFKFFIELNFLSEIFYCLYLLAKAQKPASKTKPKSEGIYKFIFIYLF